MIVNSTMTYKDCHTIMLSIFIITVVLGLSEASLKRGVCIAPREYYCNDTNVFHNIGWWYDWGEAKGEHTHHCHNKAHDGYVPMLWGRSSLHKGALPQNSTYVLAFNEPNQMHQSHMSPETVAGLWPELEKKAGNRTIVSPALAGCSDAHRCITWFTEFFKHCNNCRVDALAAHSYSCNADHVVSSLKTIAQHFGKKIWLTEFACAAGKTVQKQMAFMAKILPQLEAASFIERYFWFVSRVHKKTSFINSAVDLLEPNTSKLNNLGKFYDQFKH